MTDHPILPCGLNSWELNGDEYNGPGANEAVAPVLFDSYEGLAPLIMNEEMQAAFDGCADYTVPCQDSMVTIPHERDTLVIK